MKRLRHLSALDAERIASLEAVFKQARADIEAWLADNASKIEAMENELAALRNQAVLDAERIRRLKAALGKD